MEIQIISAWFLLCLLVAVYANRLGRNPYIYFIMTIIGTPLFVWILLLIQGEETYYTDMIDDYKNNLKAEQDPKEYTCIVCGTYVLSNENGCINCRVE